MSYLNKRNALTYINTWDHFSHLFYSWIFYWCLNINILESGAPCRWVWKFYTAFSTSSGCLLQQSSVLNVPVSNTYQLIRIDQETSTCIIHYAHTTCYLVNFAAFMITLQINIIIFAFCIIFFNSKKLYESKLYSKYSSIFLWKVTI